MYKVECKIFYVLLQYVTFIKLSTMQNIVFEAVWASAGGSLC